MKRTRFLKSLTALAGVVLATAPALWGQTISQLTADSQTFDAYFTDFDGQEWLLIGRGREGWEFDTDGQGTPSEVGQNVGTTAAFAPKCYSDAIIIDLLDQQGDTSMANLEVRLARASDTAGTVEFQDVRWTAFTGNGDAFTWNIEDSQYGVTTDFKNAPAGLSGAAISTHTGSNTRDANHSNNARRIFTWSWGGHGGEKGFSYGQSVTGILSDANTFIWDHPNNGNNHAIPYTEVYIPYVSGPDVAPPTLDLVSPADEAAGVYPAGNLVGTFNENIALVSGGTITITDTDDGSGTQVISLLDPTQVTVLDKVLTIDPATNLEFGTNYEVTIDALSIEDTATIPNAYGGTLAGDWNFTTAAQNLTAPTVTTYVPADEAPAVGPADNLVLTFDQDLVLNSGTICFVDENFDSGDGGFTLKVAGAAGTPWAHGVPDSAGLGGVVDDDNGGGGQCWATGLGDFTASGAGFEGYFVDPTTTCLRTGVIDLTTVDSAQLTFAEALDLEAGDTAVVNIIDDTTDTVIATVYTADDSGATSDANWNDVAAIDLAAGIGQLVRIEWCLTGFGGASDDYLGWYIDDVKVSGISDSDLITLKDLTNATETVIAIDDSSQVSVSGAVLTIDPTDILTPGVSYAVQIGTTAIRNFSDVGYAGIGDDVTWNFDTASDAVFIASATTGTNNDSWTEFTNWDIGSPPSEVLTATITTGLTALANSNAVVTYSGGLTLEANSTLQIGSGGSTENRTQSALALGTGTITMEAGSKIQWQMKVSPTMPPMVLNGDASIVLASNESHARNFTFGGGISGTGQLTFRGVNNNSHTFNTANPSWSGGFVGEAEASCRTRYRATAAGSLGTGNVTINNCTDLENSGDAIDDSAVLSLNGQGRDQSVATKLIMNGSDTVDQLWIDGIQYPSGTYSVGGPADFVGPTWMSGGSTLTVTTGPTETVLPTVLTIDDNKPGGQIFDNGNVTYTVTFSEAVIGSTVEVADFGNAGTATASVDSVTEIGLDTYEVVVSVSSTGTLQLQINMGAVIEDFATNELDTTAPILDPTVINVIPFVANSATIANDFQGTIASEQHPTYAGEARYYHVSVNPANPGTGSFAATIVGTNNPAPAFVRNYTDPVLSYKFLGGTNNSVSGVAASGGDDTLITYATEDTSFDGFGQGQAKIWDATDPGADLQTVTDPYNASADKSGGGYRSFGGAVGTVDISGMAAGSLHIYYGSFSATPSVRVSLVDSTGLHPDVTIADAHSVADGGNGDAANRTEYYLAEIDFTTDGIYDTIEYEWLANGSNYGGNGRGLGTVLTGPLPDTTPPTWIATWPQVDGVTATDATARGQIDEDGTAYFVVVPDGATAPSSAEVKAGTGAGGSGQVASGSIVLTANTEGTAAISGLTASTAYDVYFVAEDGEPNLQAAPVLVDITTMAGGTPFQIWATGGETFDGDANGDGVQDGLAFMLGAATPGTDASALLTITEDGSGNLVLTFPMLNAANRGASTLSVQHSNDLNNIDLWTTVLVPDASGGPTDFVTFTVTPGSPTNSVVASVASSEAADGKLFGRLEATE